MSLKPGFLMRCAALLVLLAVVMPGMAHAAVVDQCQDGTIDQGYQTAMGTAAQQKIQIANSTLNLFPPVDINNYCWNRVEALFDFAIVTSDPLGIAANLLWDKLKAAFQQTCNGIVSTLGSIVSGALSQLNYLCLPNPVFKIGGFAGLNLGLQPQTCSGIPALGVIPSPAMTNWQSIDPQKILPAGP